MLSQVSELPWDHGNAPVLTLKLATLMPMCSWNFKGSTNRRLQKNLSKKPIWKTAFSANAIFSRRFQKF